MLLSSLPRPPQGVRGGGKAQLDGDRTVRSVWVRTSAGLRDEGTASNLLAVLKGPLACVGGTSIEGATDNRRAPASRAGRHRCLLPCTNVPAIFLILTLRDAEATWYHRRSRM